MRILIDINHPAHIHLFKHFAWNMEKKGHDLFFTTRKKEVTIDLLEKYKFKYKSFGNHKKSLFGKVLGFIIFDWKLLKTSLRFKPDLYLTMGGMYAGQVSFLMRKPHIALDDTEHARFHHLMYLPFTEVCLNPVCFHKNFGKKQIFYKGYHELAYLHPNYFKPDESILEKLGIQKDEKYIFVRFVSWNASHDIGHEGFSPNDKIELVKQLSKYAKVFISSEGQLPAELEDYRLKTSPELIHHVLNFASLFIGEGSTMASEAACLGTPAIYINSLEVGYCTEQEKYGLVYNYRTSKGVLNKALELITEKELVKRSEDSLKKMLSEKIDVTAFLEWFVEEYPQSVKIMKKDPNYDNKFI
jgi:predicted glycosyltransferase